MALPEGEGRALPLRKGAFGLAKSPLTKQGMEDAHWKRGAKLPIDVRGTKRQVKHFLVTKHQRLVIRL